MKAKKKALTKKKAVPKKKVAPKKKAAAKKASGGKAVGKRAKDEMMQILPRGGQDGHCCSAYCPTCDQSWGPFDDCDSARQAKAQHLQDYPDHKPTAFCDQ